MTFSDSDLERLKDQLKRNDPADNFTSIETMKALLARLEAAERICEGIQNLCENHPEFSKGQAVTDLEAWRKAAGK